MTKKIIWIAIAIGACASISYACYKKKQCCKKDYSGMSCVQKCDYEFCPYNYPIEIK